MENLDPTIELWIRLGFFMAIFISVAVWEIIAPRRRLLIPKARRWASNLGLLILNSMVVRFLFPVAAVGFAVFARDNHWGLFNQFELPLIVSIVICVVTLDCLIYWQHRIMHIMPILWRLHRVHHADLDTDLTTGSRFHPIEIFLSMLIKCLAIFLLGPPVLAVLIFEVLLNGMAMFNHANASLPPRIDSFIRQWLVTPDMHRVHHSIKINETNSNYGFNLSIWDRIFSSYIEQPESGHDDMTIGIGDYRDPVQVNRLPGMLMIPFTRARPK
jgi:sterol desaturase/sphingolipid hydroxylase (fatty acid hydroxylase superfamily)